MSRDVDCTKPIPVMAIYADHIDRYDSINCTAKALGISRRSVMRALERVDGYIPGLDVSLDLAYTSADFPFEEEPVCGVEQCSEEKTSEEYDETEYCDEKKHFNRSHPA